MLVSTFPKFVLCAGTQVSRTSETKDVSCGALGFGKPARHAADRNVSLRGLPAWCGRRVDWAFRALGPFRPERMP